MYRELQELQGELQGTLTTYQLKAVECPLRASRVANCRCTVETLAQGFSEERVSD